MDWLFPMTVAPTIHDHTDEDIDPGIPAGHRSRERFYKTYDVYSEAEDDTFAEIGLHTERVERQREAELYGPTPRWGVKFAPDQRTTIDLLTAQHYITSRTNHTATDGSESDNSSSESP